MDGGGDEVTLCSLISLLKTEHPEKLASKPALSFPHPTVQDIESLESYPDLGVETISGLEKHNTGDSAFRPQNSTISSSENTVNNRRTPVAGFGKHSVLPPKSCLTRVVLQTPAKPNQKKKTVAFGKTVNVSQTVEGTSRLAKQKAEMNKYSKTSPAEVTNKENNDPTTIREDQQKLSSVIDTTMEMKESIQVLTRQIQENEKNIEILKKEKEEMHKEILETKAQIEKLGNILTGYVEMTLPDRYSGEKEQAFPRIINSRKNEKVQKGKIPHYEDDRYESAKSKFDVDTDLDSLTLAELRRLMDKNPVFRQYVADIRAEEEEERKNYRIKQNKLDWDKNDGRQGEKCMQRTVEREAWQKDEDKRANNRRGATITQKFTVERSIHCSPSSRMSPYSVDTNHFLSDRGVLKESDVNAYDDVQSIYQPGESISYHPQRYKSSRYTVQSPSDEERRSDIERRRDRGDRDETAAEERRRLRRERRAKQKF